MLTQSHFWVVMVMLSGSAGQDFSSTLKYRVGVCAFQIVQKLAVAVQVVKVFQKAEVQHLPQVRVWLMTSQVGGQIYGYLFEGKGGLQNCLVGGVEPVDGGLLLLLHHAGAGQQRFDLRISRTPGEVVRVGPALVF